ncbi:hypothetical protein QMK33_10660 [Hymenobacter sp. H14-R3]|uniref:DUF6891 domain-containing protein n=1 Tax=Hymenobacter sp. H14-R3 TaxID=3046308 RepID=UPI0024B934D8|nr:hypothetical protein [Hymenobacter sp. H14-R3]MDJ0365615.1 hypothetical protein [Hymenobacter sp. H14-R3]
MDETTEEYAAAIHLWVWSGFYLAEEVVDMLSEQLKDEEEAADEPLLQRLIAQEFAAKQQAEATWPASTDCDRLDQAFATLKDAGIVCLHNAGYTMSDGLDDVAEALDEHQSAATKGYCFYHAQDLERAAAGSGLWLAYGSLDDEAATKKLVGQHIQAAMQESGLVVEWDGDSKSRIQLPHIDWKRRYAE